ncbi:MAG TPA: HAD-IB family hydrolase [Cellvibrio sp.]|nr:HAD-IB family hydrolase [Cellvibrio sp.]
MTAYFLGITLPRMAAIEIKLTGYFGWLMESQLTTNITNTCAFFDVDQTIWSEKSVVSFWIFYLKNKYPESCEEQITQFQRMANDLYLKSTPREKLNEWFYEYCFKGEDLSEIQKFSELWCEQYFKKDNFWHKEVLKKINFHKSLGHLVVLVSGSFAEILKPLADYIGATDVLCSPLEIKDNRFTGKMLSSPMIGHGKAEAVLEYITKNKVCTEKSFGYGDDISDLPFMSILGNSTLIIKDETEEIRNLSTILNCQKMYLGKVSP